MPNDKKSSVCIMGFDLEGERRLKLSDDDVVCGRTGMARLHPGNRRFRKLIQEFGQAYQTATNRKTKKSITTSIIKMIFSKGGEFLRASIKDSSTDPEAVDLQVASEEFIYEKVSHALRSYRPSLSPFNRGCGYAGKCIKRDFRGDSEAGSSKRSRGPQSPQGCLSTTPREIESCGAQLLFSSTDFDCTKKEQESYPRRMIKTSESIDWEPLHLNDEEQVMHFDASVLLDLFEV